MSLIAQLLRRGDDRAPLRPLYDAIVAEGRDPAWYRDGGVPDTIDGRFDMIAAVLALVLIRLEEEGDDARRESALLTELFVDDMDGGLRQMGIGDLVVGKHVGRLMGALGGRLSSLREAIAAGAGFADPVRRNIFRGSPPSDDAVDWVARRLERIHGDLTGLDRDALLAGTIA